MASILEPTHLLPWAKDYHRETLLSGNYDRHPLVSSRFTPAHNPTLSPCDCASLLGLIRHNSRRSLTTLNCHTALRLRYSHCLPNATRRTNVPRVPWRERVPFKPARSTTISTYPILGLYSFTRFLIPISTTIFCIAFLPLPISLEKGTFLFQNNEHSSKPCICRHRSRHTQRSGTLGHSLRLDLFRCLDGIAGEGIANEIETFHLPASLYESSHRHMGRISDQFLTVRLHSSRR
jgi:hypothetical protein